MSRAACLIDGEPLLVATAAASFAREQTPGLATVDRAPQVVAEKGEVNVRLKAQIEKLPDLVGVCNRVAAENVILQNTGKRPSGAAVTGVSPATLPEVGCYVVELPPGDCHLAAVCGVNGNGALVCSVAQDVVPICIDVCLETRKRTELRDHPRRGLHLSRRRGRIIERFKRLILGRLQCRCQLS